MQAPERTTLTRPALLLICVTVFVSVINGSMATVVLPDVQEKFDVGPDALSWVITAYIITFATGTVIYGRLGDRLGTRRMYLFGLTVFGLASLAVSFAPTFGSLVAMRALQGAGATAIPALSIATTIRTTSQAERGSALGATVLAVGLGFATGPILGGALVELAGWPAPFVTVGLIALVLVPVSRAFLPDVEGFDDEPFDFVGAALVVSAVTATVIVLNRLPRDIGDALGLVALPFAAAAWVAFVARVQRAANPFLSREIAGNGQFWGLAMVGYANQGAHFGVVVLIPLLLTDRWDTNIFTIGLWMLPGALAIATFGLMGGQLLNKLGARPLLIGGAAVCASGAIVFHLWGVDGRPWVVSCMYLWIASGYGLIQAAAISAATGAVEERLAGLASGAFNLAFFLGGAVSVAISGAILRGRESATSGLNPLFRGEAAAFSDALLVIVVYTLAAVALSLRFAPRR